MALNGSKLYHTVAGLCTPALVYAIISIVGLLVMLYQNAGQSTQYCVGNVGCNVKSTPVVFVSNIIWIIFWTWILNIICRGGYPGIAWFLVLLPLVLFLIVMVFFADMIVATRPSITMVDM
jgi:hypothetical protein